VGIIAEYMTMLLANRKLGNCDRGGKPNIKKR
jgi:hypothetical protein